MKRKLNFLVFEATRDCNLRCRYCYNYWHAVPDGEKKYSFSTAAKTLKRLYREADVGRVTFSGGEPLLAEGIEELVLEARMRGSTVGIISNGTVGTSKRYRTLLDLGVSPFQFPLLSHREDIHDALAQVPGSFRKSTESIRTVLRQGGSVAAAFVMTAMNVRDFRGTVELAETLGVPAMMLARYNIGGRGISFGDALVPTLSDLRDTFREASDYGETGKVKLSANVCVPHCAVDPAEYPGLWISSCGANPGMRPITMDFEGNVRICNHSPRIIGNIHRDRLADILDSEYVKSWETVKPSKCNDCAKWKQCMGGCRAASEQLGTGLEAEDPVLSVYQAV